MATSLPPELWHLIISHLSLSSPSSPPSSSPFPVSPHSHPAPHLTYTLLSLALTCSALTPIAQSHLFSSLTPSPARQLSAHRGVVRTFEEKPWLARYVRVMGVGMPTAYKSGVLDAKALVGILNRLENLEVLRIEGSFSLCNFSSCMADKETREVLRAMRRVLRSGTVKSVVVSQMNGFDMRFLKGCAGVQKVVLSECRLGMCSGLESLWCEDDEELGHEDEDEKPNSQSEKGPQILVQPTHLDLSSHNLEHLLQLGFISSLAEESDLEYPSPSSSYSSSSSSSPSLSLSPSPSPPPRNSNAQPLISLSFLSSLVLSIPPSSSLSPTTLAAISTLVQRLEYLEVRVGLLDFHNQPWSTLDSLLSSSLSPSLSSPTSTTHTPTPRLRMLRIHILPDSAGWCYDMDIATAHLDVRFEGLREVGVRVEVLGSVC